MSRARASAFLKLSSMRPENERITDFEILVLRADGRQQAGERLLTGGEPLVEVRPCVCARRSDESVIAL